MKLTVNLPHNPYDILIERGSLSQVGSWVKGLWNPQKIAIITDDLVGRLYSQTVQASLEQAGFDTIVFEFPEGEASKNLETVYQAYEFLVKNGMTCRPPDSTLTGMLPYRHYNLIYCPASSASALYPIIIHAQ